ncbi:MAG: general secretion pathway protein GspB [Nitrospirota bacterium]|nr:general secretion pathway protein GspB [Nitrospirota bacterium]
MSFILDALKNLEEKRRQESVPDLNTVHFSTPPEEKKRAAWPYIVIVLALLINAGILAAWLLQRDTAEQDTAATSKTITPAAPAKRSDSAVLPAKKTVSPGPAAVVTGRSSKKPDAAPEKVTAHQESPSTNTAGTRLDMSPGQIKDLKEQILKERAPMDGPSYSHPADGADAEESRQADVPELGQLPASAREGLPVMNISSHIYSNDPRARVVNINGTVVREGESVVKGLKVEEITMTGVILDYRGRRFRIRAF